MENWVDGKRKGGGELSYGIYSIYCTYELDPSLLFAKRIYTQLTFLIFFYKKKAMENLIHFFIFLLLTVGGNLANQAL